MTQPQTADEDSEHSDRFRQGVWCAQCGTDCVETYGIWKCPKCPPELVARSAAIPVHDSVVPIDQLLAKRDELKAEYAELDALYGIGGLWNDLRKKLLASIAHGIRTEAKVKLTEAAIDDAAHADPTYGEFVETSARERERWRLLDIDLLTIRDRIKRGDSTLHLLSAEARMGGST